MCSADAPSTCWSWTGRTRDTNDPGAQDDAGQHPAEKLPRREHLKHDCGLTVFQHASKMGLEDIVSKRLGSRSGRSPGSLKFKNPVAPAVRREAEEDWGRR